MASRFRTQTSRKEDNGAITTTINLPAILVHAVCQEFAKTHDLSHTRYKVNPTSAKITNITINGEHDFTLLSYIKGYQEKVMTTHFSSRGYFIEDIINICHQIRKDSDGIKDVFFHVNGKQEIEFIGLSRSINEFKETLETILEQTPKNNVMNTSSKFDTVKKLLSKGYKELLDSKKRIFIIYEDEDGTVSGRLTDFTRLEDAEKTPNLIYIQENIQGNISNFSYKRKN